MREEELHTETSLSADEVCEAVHEAFHDLGREYGDAVASMPRWSSVRDLRRRDNVGRPSRFYDSGHYYVSEAGVPHVHGLVVHVLTTRLAVQRAEIAKLKGELAAARVNAVGSDEMSAEDFRRVSGSGHHEADESPAPDRFGVPITAHQKSERF